LQAARGRNQISLREKHLMAGLLFLLEVAVFVLAVYWAYRNSAIGADGGSGFFAMKGEGPAPARRPRWKPAIQENRKPVGAPSGRTHRWKTPPRQWEDRTRALG
jgi:hypothetical protein